MGGLSPQTAGLANSKTAEALSRSTNAVALTGFSPGLRGDPENYPPANLGPDFQPDFKAQDTSTAQLSEILQLATQQRLDQAALTTIFNNTDATGQACLLELLKRPDISVPQLDAVIEHLNTIAAQDLHTGLNPRRAELLASIIQEVALPDSINQGQLARCPVAEEERNLCKTHPDEYVRIWSELSSPAGVATLQNGEKMALSLEAMNERGPKLSMCLFQDSAMRHITAHYGHAYSADSHVAVTGPPPFGYQGLWLVQQQWFHRALTLEATTCRNTNGSLAVADTLLQDAANEIAKGKGGVRAQIRVRTDREAEHCITIDKIDYEKGIVTFHNPWPDGTDSLIPERTMLRNGPEGICRLETMSIEDFKKCLAATLQPNGGTENEIDESTEPWKDQGIREGDFIVLQVRPADFVETPVEGVKPGSRSTRPAPTDDQPYLVNKPPETAPVGPQLVGPARTPPVKDDHIL